jgi:hypothetical protein
MPVQSANLRHSGLHGLRPDGCESGRCGFGGADLSGPDLTSEFYEVQPAQRGSEGRHLAEDSSGR